MNRKNLMITIALGATATALFVSAGAYAKGQGMMAQQRPSFAELDSDGDGSLSTAEIQARADARFAAMDSNGDGVISADENAAAMAQKAAERAEMRFARLLEWRDADGDGALSQLEMGDNRAERVFSRADANSDGMISAEEYEQALERGPRGGQKRGPGHRQGG